MKGGEEVKKGMKKESAKLSRQKRSPLKDFPKPCHQFITWESEGKGGGAVG
ncbi:MAG: hypothetical protein VB085_08700 [Peptococcaceae bacterium]|nr:hypothetical protein [Peptococcaceae bacterium]